MNNKTSKARARLRSSTLSDNPNTRNKRYSPEVYAALQKKRAERERVTGNSEKGRKL